MNETSGVLVLAGTPIGNVADASPALARALLAADRVAAEDTRRFRQLCDRLGIEVTAPVVSYFDGNEASRTPTLTQHLADGERVVLVTDAGMPSVSDPGYRLVVAAIELGVEITAVPGPSAVTTALAVSGLPVDRFCFEGFLPRKPGPRRRRLEELATEPRTMVFFEAPHRLEAFLADAAQTLGAERPAAVCRELTKTYQEVKRGGLAALASWAAEGVRGEITVVIAPAPEEQTDPDDALAQVAALVASGTKMSAAVRQVAAATGLDRTELYNQAVGQK
ncbi:16S rRNA (cytidine(1402)-2'-O)-methyltransferase [Parenemella sanctibonifatiensis]|uniref:Ribosomal RNA small subunit methyltransferase I n=1 Tax=Parenemella sanctibonifatiensis TaxID=2016505 RepID=A0A255ELG9_9ACTN|nr:16S rRNA (cytidine(1402)-2'-O)-methyltransferase [Parenemella sanctibonifatiensis]OYN90455.1 16S rRNA (cytidine(1402)-2'-O)-methyltransferase [Parenemella sanctibonifatiensis]